MSELCCAYRERLNLVLRGLDPRIHVFIQTAQSRGWPGQARPRRNWGAISFSSSPQYFPRTVLRFRGNDDNKCHDTISTVVDEFFRMFLVSLRSQNTRSGI